MPPLGRSTMGQDYFNDAQKAVVFRYGRSRQAGTAYPGLKRCRINRMLHETSSIVGSIK